MSIEIFIASSVSSKFDFETKNPQANRGLQSAVEISFPSNSIFFHIHNLDLDLMVNKLNFPIVVLIFSF